MLLEPEEMEPTEEQSQTLFLARERLLGVPLALGVLGPVGLMEVAPEEEVEELGELQLPYYSDL